MRFLHFLFLTSWFELKRSVISLSRVLGTNNPSLQVENKEPVCFVFLCDQKGWWQVGQAGQPAAPPSSPAHGLASRRCPQRQGRAGTAGASLLPLVLHKELESGENMMGTRAEAVPGLVSPSSTPPEKAYVSFAQPCGLTEVNVETWAQDQQRQHWAFQPLPLK